MFGRNKKLEEKCFICDLCGDGYGLNDIGYIGVGVYCKYCNPLKPLIKVDPFQVVSEFDELKEKMDRLVKTVGSELERQLKFESQVNLSNKVTDLEKKLKYQQLHNELVNNSLRRLEEDYRRRESEGLGKKKVNATAKRSNTGRTKKGNN